MGDRVQYTGGHVYDATSDKWYTDLEQAIDDIEYDGESKAADHVLETSEEGKCPVPDLWEHIVWAMNQDTHEGFDPSEHLSAELAAAVADVQTMLEGEAPTAHFSTGKRILIPSDASQEPDQ